jgi:hypothetical protein
LNAQIARRRAFEILSLNQPTDGFVGAFFARVCVCVYFWI